MKRSSLVLLLPVAAAIGVACGGDDSSPSGNAGTTATPPAATGTALSSTSALAGLPNVRLERVFPALSFDQITGLYEMPGTPSRFVALERKGRILIFDNRQDVAQKTVFLDITSRVNSGGSEEGLLGLTFPPDFERSRQFYVNYTAQNPRRTVISRFTVGGAGLQADPASEFKILEIGQPFANHNGGQIVFGPDGYLYIGMGDGGSQGDPMGNGQNLGALLAKMLRIDPSATSEGRNYRVPSDNPFVGRSGARDEVWAYGLRNPWRFSFDTATGDLWVADVGASSREEIDLVRRGGNYGWSRFEGTQCRGSGSACDASGITQPLLEYDRSGDNCSVIGGGVYRGDRASGLRGAYVYSDFCSGRVWALRYDGQRVTEQRQIADSDSQISSFATDRQGDMYLLGYAQRGGVFRITQ